MIRTPEDLERAIKHFELDVDPDWLERNSRADTAQDWKQFCELARIGIRQVMIAKLAKELEARLA